MLISDSISLIASLSRRATAHIMRASLIAGQDEGHLDRPDVFQAGHEAVNRSV